MMTDEHSEEADLSQTNGSDDQDTGDSQDQGTNDQQGDQGNTQDDQQDSSQDDYRAKLNIQNRFLEKEGYKFEGGKWVKPQQSSGQQQQKDSSQDSQQTATPALSRDEAILIAQGKSVEEVEHAQKVATLQNKPLLEAVNDPLYTTWEAQTRKEAKDKAAQLGVSRGGRASVKKTFNTPGLSDDDHKQMFNDKIGK